MPYRSILPIRKQLPPFIAITEGTDPLRRNLPPCTLVILRDYDDPERERKATALAQLCRRKRWKLLIAGDPSLAVKVRAAGIHMPEGLAWRLHGWIARKPHWLVTMATHSEAALWRACRLDVDAALLSPVFTTASHPEATPLGTLRFSAITRRVPVPTYALGGITTHTLRRLKNCNATGAAAMGLAHEKPEKP